MLEIRSDNGGELYKGTKDTLMASIAGGGGRSGTSSSPNFVFVFVLCMKVYIKILIESFQHVTEEHVMPDAIVF